MSRGKRCPQADPLTSASAAAVKRIKSNGPNAEEVIHEQDEINRFDRNNILVLVLTHRKDDGYGV